MRTFKLGIVIACVYAASVVLGVRPCMAALAPIAITRAVSLWDTEHGLPSSKISAVAKTPDGYVWLATADGLTRFDGLRFTVFDHGSSSALPGTGVDDLIVDGRGVLWILAKGRVIRRDGDVFADASPSLGGERGNRIWIGDDGCAYIATDSYMFRCTKGTPTQVGSGRLPEVCYSFADLPDGEVLAGGSQGRLYAAKDGTVAAIGGPSLLGNGSVTVAPDHHGGAWIACANGVFHKLGDRFEKLSSSAPLKDLAWMWTTQDSTPNLVCDASGMVWVQNGGTLNRLQGGVLGPCPMREGGPLRCARMGLDNRGRLWALSTTDSGNSLLYAWNGRRFEKLDPNGPLLGGVRIPVCTDDENGYWIGAQPGLIWSRVQTCRTFGPGDGLPAGELTSAAASPLGFYVGSRGGLYRLNGDRFVRDAGPLSDSQITSLTALAPDDMWVGREGMEIAKLDHGVLLDFQSRYPVRRYSNIMRMAVRDGKGRVWASDGVLLFRWDAQGAQRVNLRSNELLQGVVTSLFVDSRDNVWAGGSGGFIEVHDGQVTPYAPNPKLTGSKVTSICEGGDGSIWFGFSTAGLARWKDGQVSVLTSAASGLPTDDVDGMARDGEGRFWIGGSRGIYCVEESALIAVADGRSATATFTRMERTDGATGGAPQSHYASCVTKDADGKLWFVCEHGVVRVDTAQFARGTAPTVLESVRVNGRRYPVNTTIVAAPGGGDLGVDYTSIRFAGSQRLRFEYRLRGYNERWTDIGSGRSAAYMNLPPGTYTFEVRSYDGHSAAPLSRASVTIVLTPYYYQTTFFRIVSLLLILMSIGMLFRLRTRMLMERTRRLEATVEARTADLVTAHETVARAYGQLEEQKQELEQHNDLLQNTQAELEAQNDELQSAQAELEAQNGELLRVREELEYEKAALAEANIHLNSLAITDGLTGLTNHRGFQDQLEREWARAMRYGQPLSLLLLDVDQFKQYNDTYGHPQGDKVLKSIAHILMDNCRDGDTAARYGGEEFVVIVPQTDEEGVVMLAERFRAAIEAFPWTDRKVTASFGVVTNAGSVENCRELIEFADKALYSSKSQGRNRVTAYTHFAAVSRSR